MVTVKSSDTKEQPAQRKRLSVASVAEKSCIAAHRRMKKKIAFFGHFGSGNFGNESTLQAMLCCLRRLAPEAEFNCICTDPDTVAMAYNINAMPSREGTVRPRLLQNRLARLGRKLVIGIPSELYRWVKSLKTLWRVDALIMPGTGVLTDAYTLLNWGPYDMFRWSVAAKLCRCKLLFVSVGAGPYLQPRGQILREGSTFSCRFPLLPGRIHAAVS